MRLRDRIFYDLTGGLWNRVLNTRDRLTEIVLPDKKHLGSETNRSTDFKLEGGITRYGLINESVDGATRSKIARLMRRDPNSHLFNIPQS